MRVSADAGRADLLEAFFAAGETGLTAMARLAGYEDSQDPNRQTPRIGATTEVMPPKSETDPDEVSPGMTSGMPFARVPFWHLESIHFLDPKRVETESRPRAEPIGLNGMGRLPGRPPPTPPIVPNAQLWPKLRQALASAVPGRDIDVDVLVDRWTHGHSVHELPRRPLRAMSQRVRVLVDRSERLIPFWDDQDHLVRMLNQRLGTAAVEEIRFYESEQRPWRSRHRADAQPPSDPDIPILALSDLGFLAGRRQQRQWASTGHRLRHGGARATAIVLCPSSRWQSATARTWNAVDWSRPNRAPRLSPSHDPQTRLARAETVLSLLAFAARIEPGLLRAVRQLLPAGAADLGTEADAWSHPKVAGGFAAAADLDPDLRRRLQARFVNLADLTKTRVVEAMRAWRAGMPKEIWLDEVLTLHLAGRLPAGVLLETEIEAAFDLWRRIAETVEGSAQAGEVLAHGVKGFARRTIKDRQPDAAWQDPRLAPLLWRAWQASWEGEGTAPLPVGGDPSLLGDDASPIAWTARQIGKRLRFVRRGHEDTLGIPLVDFESGNGLVSLYTPTLRFAHEHPLAQAAPLPPPAVTHLELVTDRVRARLRCLVSRPHWASAMGQDRVGLWAELEVENITQRLRWMPPGRYFMGSPAEEPRRHSDEGPRHLETLEHGFWLADTPCTQALWQAVMGKNPSHFQGPARPVENVSFRDVRDFFAKLNRLVPGFDARLPSEVEWEYACRAGTTTATYAGAIKIDDKGRSAELEKIAWYRDNSGGETHAVGEKLANPWGLYDMLGNVLEWCDDHWSSHHDAKREGTNRVFRGGSWFSIARYVRAAYRFLNEPSDRWHDQGFRLVRGQGALRQGAERKVPRAEPDPRGAERPGGGARRGTRRRSRPSRPEAATE